MGNVYPLGQCFYASVSSNEMKEQPASNGCARGAWQGAIMVEPSAGRASRTQGFVLRPRATGPGGGRSVGGTRRRANTREPRLGRDRSCTHWRGKEGGGGGAVGGFFPPRFFRWRWCGEPRD